MIKSGINLRPWQLEGARCFFEEVRVRIGCSSSFLHSAHCFNFPSVRVDVRRKTAVLQCFHSFYLEIGGIGNVYLASVLLFALPDHFFVFDFSRWSFDLWPQAKQCCSNFFAFVDKPFQRSKISFAVIHYLNLVGSVIQCPRQLNTWLYLWGIYSFFLGLFDANCQNFC